jgi:adenylate cyclase
VDVSQVARDLSVRYVLEGSIRRLGPRVRIKAQLIEALSGNHLWAEKFDRDLAEIFEVQDEVVRAVAACTQTRLIITEGEAAERGRNIDAWALITRGWTEIYRLTRESLESAAEIGRRLVAHYPSLSKGHHILASALHHLVIMGFYRGTQDIQDVIVSEAREAVRLDPTDEYALWVLAMVLSDALGRPQEAIPLLRQALSLNPNFSLGYGLLGNAYSQLNQPDEAIKYTEIAIRLNPRDPSVFFRYAVLAEANFAKQDHQQTLHWANQSAALKPDYWYSHALIASTLAISGDMDGAKRAMANLQASMQGVSVSAIQQTGYYPEPWWSRFAQGLIAAGALP